MNQKKRRSLIGAWLLHWLAAVMYLTGIAFLIPLAVLMIFPPNVFILPQNAEFLTLLSLGLVVLGALIVITYKKSTGGGLQYLAYCTLIPAILAVIFILFGKQEIIALLGFLGKLKPLAEGYLEYWSYFVPHAWLSTAGYWIIAAILWTTGNRIKRRESTESWIQKIFGRKARIIR